MTCLELTVESHTGSHARQILVEHYPFDIGRALHNDLPLPYPSVSGRHLVIEQRDDATIQITDLQSTNGTCVDDRRIPPHQPYPLELPARIQLGDVFIGIRSVSPDADTAFTMARSSTQLRQMVDDAVRQSEDDQTRPFFEILSGPKTGRRFIVDPGDSTLFIGTTSDCAVTLDLPEFPEQLAAIHRAESDCWIAPEAAGIEFEHRPLQQRRRLRSGDRFVIGAVELLYFDPLEKTLASIEQAGVHQRQTERTDHTDTPQNSPPDDPDDKHEDDVSTDTGEMPDAESKPDIEAKDDPSTPIKKPVSADETVDSNTGFEPFEIGLLAISATVLVATVGLLVVFFWN